MRRLNRLVLAITLAATHGCDVNVTGGDWTFTLDVNPETGTYWLTDVFGVSADPFADPGMLTDPPQPRSLHLAVGDSVLTLYRADLGLTSYPDTSLPTTYTLSLSFCNGEATPSAGCHGTSVQCTWSGTYDRQPEGDAVIAELAPSSPETSEPGYDCPMRPATWTVKSADVGLSSGLNRIAVWRLETVDPGLGTVAAVFYRINN